MICIDDGTDVITIFLSDCTVSYPEEYEESKRLRNGDYVLVQGILMRSEGSNEPCISAMRLLLLVSSGLASKKGDANLETLWMFEVIDGSIHENRHVLDISTYMPNDM